MWCGPDVVWTRCPHRKHAMLVEVISGVDWVWTGCPFPKIHLSRTNLATELGLVLNESSLFMVFRPLVIFSNSSR